MEEKEEEEEEGLSKEISNSITTKYAIAQVHTTILTWEICLCVVIVYSMFLITYCVVLLYYIKSWNPLMGLKRI